MISKSRRKNTGSVEKLQQASFTIAKGMDESASILEPAKVLYLKNLDIDNDGSLILRKPLKVIREFPKLSSQSPIKAIPIVNNYTLLIFQISSTTYVAVVDGDNTSIPISIEYVKYTDFTEAEILNDTLTTLTYSTSGGKSGLAYALDFFNFNKVTFANLTTTTLLYGVDVNFTNSVFNNALVNNILINTNVVTRAVGIYVKPEEPSLVRFKIYPTEPVNLTFADGELALDANLYADSPYALRDTYKQSVATVKGILFYGNTTKSNGEVRLNTSYKDEAITQPVSKVLSVFENADISRTEEYLEALDSVSSNNLTIQISPEASVFGAKAQINYTGGAYYTPLRAGVQKFNIPIIDIQYGQTMCWSIPDDISKYVPHLNTSPALPQSIHSVRFSELCSVSANFTGNLLTVTDSAPYIHLYLNAIECEVPVDLSFKDTDSRKYFIEDTESTSNIYKVPKVIADFISPDLWKNTVYMRNFIPSVMVAAFGNAQLGIFEWSKRYEDSDTYKSHVYCKRYESEDNIFISFLKGTSYGGTSFSADKCLTLKFSKQASQKTINFGIEDLQLQGFTKKTVMYRSTN